MRRFGLIGKNISYSFSKSYFSNKFKEEQIEDTSYENFDLENITEFQGVLQNNPNLKGLNVTIPYKELVIPYLDKLSKKAKKIGAVNTIKVSRKGQLKGYNTDYFGFITSIKPALKPSHQSALILGTGGASKAIAYALKKMKIAYTFVSRTSSKSVITYNNLSEMDIKNNFLIINCTPLGTAPNLKSCPDIPYQALTKEHILFDLNYNPKETTFLKLGRLNGALTVNGIKMLELQAEKSWEIWNR